MTTKVVRMLGVAWPCVACLGLLPSPISAQEPTLRDTLKGHSGPANCVAYSPDGKTLASASGQTIMLWDAAMGKELAAFRGHTSGVYSVAYRPDGKTLASGSMDTTIKLWDVATGKELATLKGRPDADVVCTVAYSPDGKTLASGGWDGAVMLWNVKTGK